MVEAFLYSMKTTLSLLITVPREKRLSANSTGPSSGLLLGTLSTNSDDLLCSVMVPLAVRMMYSLEARAAAKALKA